MISVISTVISQTPSTICDLYWHLKEIKMIEKLITEWYLSRNDIIHRNFIKIRLFFLSNMRCINPNWSSYYKTGCNDRNIQNPLLIFYTYCGRRSNCEMPLTWKIAFLSFLMLILLRTPHLLQKSWYLKNY